MRATPRVNIFGLDLASDLQTFLYNCPQTSPCGCVIGTWNLICSKSNWSFPKSAPPQSSLSLRKWQVCSAAAQAKSLVAITLLFLVLPISNLATSLLPAKYNQNQWLLTTLVQSAIIFHLGFDSSFLTDLFPPLPHLPVVYTAARAILLNLSQFRPFLCSELSRCLPFQWFTRPYVIYTHPWLFWSQLLLLFLPPVYSAAASPGLLLFLRSQTCPCPGIFAQAISFLCSNLSPDLHLAFSLASFGSFQISLVSKIFSDHPI